MLETERLILRNYKITDLDDYFEYVSMKSIGPRLGWEPYTDIKKAEERLRFEMSKPYQFAIVLKEENKVIGSIELMDIKEDRYINQKVEEGSKEIGYMLSEKYWNKGIMTEALREVMRFAFEDLNIPVIYIGHVEANIGSARVQEKCGFEIIDKVSNYQKWIDGKDTDLIERKMTKEEYFKKLN